EHYHACPNVEKSCVCQNQPLLEGRDLHYVQQRLAPHWREANRLTIKKILVACGTALLLGLAVSGLLHSWRLFRRHTRAIRCPLYDAENVLTTATVSCI
ncbi:hypothetical protein EDD17DRAFT_1746824, partial [Pisolithus thermaeus]